MKQRTMWGLALVLAGGIANGESGGIKNQQPIKITTPRIVPLNTPLIPIVSAEKTMPRYKLDPILRPIPTCPSNWLDKTRNYKYRTCSHLMSTSLDVLDINESIWFDFYSATISYYNYPYLYIMLSSFNRFGFPINDELYGTKSFPQDDKYRHPEILKVNLTKKTFRLISFLAWAQYSDSDRETCQIYPDESSTGFFSGKDFYKPRKVINYYPTNHVFSPNVKCKIFFTYDIEKNIGKYSE